MGVRSKILQAVGRNSVKVDVLPVPVMAQRAPGSDDLLPAGQLWVDQSVSPNVIYTSLGTGDFEVGGNPQATETTAGIARIATAAEATTGTDDTTIMTPAKVALIAIAGAPDATEVTKGIAMLATQAEAEAGTNDTDIMTPLKVAQAMAAGVGPGSFTTLDASGAVTFASTGAIEMTSDTASFFDVTGAGVDLTLSSDAGRVIVNGEEAAANAITLLSAAGGIDADAALQINIASSQNAVDAIRIVASAGGIDIDAVGAATEDINITNTGGSIVLSATENVADSIVISSTAGGIDITAAGAATEDIDIVNTAGSVVISGGEAVADAINIDAAAGGIDVDCAGQLNLASSQNAADAVVIIASAGGVDITATGTAGEDLDLLASGSSVNVTATEDAAQAIYLRANGGTSETVQIHADQGTGVASINILSDVGGVTVQSGLGSADAINLNASAAGGGIDIDSGTAGFIVDTTGGISLDSAAASNFTATGAFDITVQSTAGSILINAGEAAADAINVDSTGGLDVDVALQMNLTSSQAAVDAVRIFASNAAGGLDLDCGTGGATLDSTGAVSVQAAAASDFSVSGAGIDLTLASAGGRVVVNGEKAAADALRLLSAAGGLDVDVALQMSLVTSQNAADAMVLNASAGGIDMTAAGAAGEDIDIVCTSGSVNITAGESAADSMVLTSNGMDVVVAGAAGRDIDVTNTGGSVNVTATENVSDAIVINASGAASGMSLDAGTAGLTIGTGLVMTSTAVNFAASPYTILGTDYYLSVSTGAGAVTVTLPAAPATGRELIVADTNGTAGASNITIGGNGKNLVGGAAAAATKVLATNYASARLIYNGTVWTYQAIA